jgi:hypothetical protein
MEDISPKVIKDKVLDILELANGFGANIDTKKIKDIKENSLFVSVYDDSLNPIKGDPATDKKGARKNLVYRLLQALWDNLESKKRGSKIGTAPPRVSNFAPNFPVPTRQIPPRESSSGNRSSTHIARVRYYSNVVSRWELLSNVFITTAYI